MLRITAAQRNHGSMLELRKVKNESSHSSSYSYRTSLPLPSRSIVQGDNSSNKMLVYRGMSSKEKLVATISLKMDNALGGVETISRTREAAQYFRQESDERLRRRCDLCAARCCLPHIHSLSSMASSESLGML